jgi:hypothetical protein
MGHNIEKVVQLCCGHRCPCTLGAIMIPLPHVGSSWTLGVYNHERTHPRSIFASNCPIQSQCMKVHDSSPKAIPAALMLASRSMTETGEAATVWMALTFKQSDGSRPRTRTVLSEQPATRKGQRWRPSGTCARAKQVTSFRLSFRSTSSSCPLGLSSK